MRIVWTVIVAGLCFLTAGAEDWTVDGKDYHNVKVTNVEPDVVHIMYDGGIGSVKLADLTPELQKRFNYDPKAAQEAAQQRATAQAQADAEMQSQIGVNQFDDFLDSHAYTVHIQVFQIGTDGALVDMSITTEKDVAVRVRDNGGVIPMSHTEHRTVTEKLKMPQKMWVIGLPDSLVDGDTWDGVVYLLGKHSYETVEHAESTVRMFAASKEAAYAYSRSYNQTGLPDSTAVNAPVTPTYVHTDTAEGRVPNQPKAYGSGVFISADGLFLTAAHVIEGSNLFQIVTHQGTMSAKLVQIDQANDVALLKCEGTFVPVTIKASNAIKLGQTVFTLGFPDIQIQGFSPKMTKGEISSLLGAQDDPRQWQVSVPVQPGNSGGPLFDEQGNLIGLIEAKLNAIAIAQATGDVPQNVNYALKSAYLIPMLDPYSAELPKEGAPPSAPRKMEDVVSQDTPSIGLVLVY